MRVEGREGGYLVAGQQETVDGQLQHLAGSGPHLHLLPAPQLGGRVGVEKSRWRGGAGPSQGYNLPSQNLMLHLPVIGGFRLAPYSQHTRSAPPSGPELWRAAGLQK